LPLLPPRRRIKLTKSLGARFCVLAALAMLASVTTGAQNRREFSVTAKKYAFAVSGSATPEIRVQQDDLVHITFSTDDIPHSFTTVESDSHYRINRRAEPGKPVSFDFRADKPGKFPIKCTLAIDDRCHEMEAWLIVEARKVAR
jgi:heme/copper-type cytochrome/quinol oxidase subunit 2